jgi:hypothetical protein
MKKYIVTAAALMFLAPMTASASEGNMQIAASDKPYVSTFNQEWYGYKSIQSYQADFNVVQFNGTTDISKLEVEAFCISKDPLDSTLTKYTFSTLTANSLNNNAAYVTWVANWATASNNTQDKIVGQAAIWTKLGVLASYEAIYSGDTAWSKTNNLSTALSDLATAYNTALNNGNYDDYINDWRIAMNYDTDGCGPDTNGQDFLVKASPVPVPSSVLLLGSGLLGLIGLGRRKER